MAKSGSARRGLAENAGAQLDIATSFLAVVLLYFVILLILAAQIGKGDQDYPHFQETPPLAPLAHRQFRTVNPFRRFWFVEGDRVAEIDLSVAASLLAEAESSPLRKNLSDGTELKMAWGAEYGPTGFRLEVTRPDSDLDRLEDGGLWAKVYTIDEFPVDEARPADVVFVRRDAAADVLGFLAQLTGDGLGPRVHILDRIKGVWQMTIVRRPQSFELESGFR